MWLTTPLLYSEQKYCISFAKTLYFIYSAIHQATCSAIHKAPSLMASQLCLVLFLHKSEWMPFWKWFKFFPRTTWTNYLMTSNINPINKVQYCCTKFNFQTSELPRIFPSWANVAWHRQLTSQAFVINRPFPTTYWTQFEINYPFSILSNHSSTVLTNKIVFL